MKKLTQIVLVSLFAAVLLSCGHDAANGNGKRSENDLETKELYTGKLGTFEGLSAETELRILQDYYKTFIPTLTLPSSFTINDLRVYNYYGTYNGYVVVSIEGDGTRAVSIIGSPYSILDIVFPWPSPSHFLYPYAWKNGEFSEIVLLYESGQLTKFDIQSIADYHKDSK